MYNQKVKKLLILLKGITTQYNWELIPVPYQLFSSIKNEIIWEMK